MPAAPAAKAKKPTADLPFEAQLWIVADTLRNTMDASEYKHVVLGPIFLKEACYPPELLDGAVAPVLAQMEASAKEWVK